MKSFVTLVVLLAAFTVAQAALNKEESLKILEKCKKDTGASEDAKHVLETQTIPDTPKGKCMMACVLEEKGLMKNGKVSAQAVSDFFEKTYADDPEQLEDTAKAVGACSTINTKGLDKCDTAVAYLKCGKENKIRL